jgi:hypothetical protein
MRLVRGGLRFNHLIRPAWCIMVQIRPYSQYFLVPPSDPASTAVGWSESASFPLLLEALSRHSEITSFGRSRFVGTQATKNLRWYQYRNLMRQAISNFKAALGVPNRSACLLYYYAMLNFAKAELLENHPIEVTGKLYHGLTFNPTTARSVAGDSLKVLDGAFRLLYEKRTGRSIPVGTSLPIKRLLANIPEIGKEIQDAGLGSCNVRWLLQMVASNGNDSWPVLALYSRDVRSLGTVTAELFLKTFEQVSITNFSESMRDQFGISRRSTADPLVYQSRDTVPNMAGNQPNILGALGITWRIRDLLGLRTNEACDAFLVPSIYRGRLLVMPPSLCRYAITFYASSLVRYRPYMFDSERYPEQAYMFDAIARECALPMLIDTLSGLEGQDQLFYAQDAFRL